jgi:hypothetical protein
VLGSALLSLGRVVVHRVRTRIRRRVRRGVGELAGQRDIQDGE